MISLLHNVNALNHGDLPFVYNEFNECLNSISDTIYHAAKCKCSHVVYIHSFVNKLQSDLVMTQFASVIRLLTLYVHQLHHDGL